MTISRTIIVAALVAFVLQHEAFAFGAIAVGDKDAKAVDSSTEKHFVATGHATLDSARSAAIKECESAGLHFCHVAAWYDQCGAYAKSQLTSGTGTGQTIKDADKTALASCGKDCQVVVAQCERDKKK